MMYYLYTDMSGSISCGGAVPQQQLCEYQAASPDEVALVKWTDMVIILFNYAIAYTITGVRASLRASTHACT